MGRSLRMNNFLPPPLVGIIAAFLYCLNVVFWPVLLFLTAFLRMLIPLPAWHRFFTRMMYLLPPCWIDGNSFIINLTTRITWEIEGLEHLKKDDWYLMISNHQSWIDILILQRIFNRRIPILKFFMKKQLLWSLPFAAWACWLLDFPFMERHGKEAIAKNPQLKGKDIETTRKACEKFKTIPTTVINFVEGTRLTMEKHKRQSSPYRYLLRPKAGGIAFTLSAMGEYFQHLLDVTIIYPEKPIYAWDFFCGKVHKIIVRVKTLPITEVMLGDYENDRNQRARFQAWLNQIWAEKDQQIADIMKRESSK
jgi:1-acyl-sn-glycerol-3-phosphate acyltransferase